MRPRCVGLDRVPNRPRQRGLSDGRKTLKFGEYMNDDEKLIRLLHFEVDELREELKWWKLVALCGWLLWMVAIVSVFTSS